MPLDEDFPPPEALLPPLFPANPFRPPPVCIFAPDDFATADLAIVDLAVLFAAVIFAAFVRFIAAAF